MVYPASTTRWVAHSNFSGFYSLVGTERLSLMVFMELLCMVAPEEERSEDFITNAGREEKRMRSLSQDLKK